MSTVSKLLEIGDALPITNPVEVVTVATESFLAGAVKKIGNVEASAVMSSMTQHAVSVAQAVDKYSEKGFGSYGIQPQQLIDLGVVKPGYLNTSEMTVTAIYDALDDPSLFTGELGINSLADLADSAIQSKVVQSGMSLTLNTLTQNGLLSPIMSAIDQATILGTSMVGAPTEIASWLSGNVDSTFGEIESSLTLVMDNVANASKFATSLAEGPGADVLGSMLDSTGIEKTIDAVVDSVDMNSLNSMTDAIIDNVKIPSIAEFEARVKSTLSGLDTSSFLPDGITGFADSLAKVDLTDLDVLDNLTDLGENLVAQTTNEIGGIIESATDLAGSVANVTNLTEGIKNIVGDVGELDLSTMVQNLPVNTVVNFASSTVKSGVTNAINNNISKITRFI